MNTKAARFSPEVRERAVRLVQECQSDYASLWGACESIAPKIGCSVSTLHGWVQRKEIEAGQRPGLTTDERERLKQLERENKELRRANDILKAASAFFCAGGAGPSHQELIDFVDQYRDAYGVEPICRLLQIAPSCYRRIVQQRNCSWLRCKRSQSDEERCTHIQRVWHANWQVYGAVKVWKQMHREGLPIARCTVQRLMRKLGLEGARRGKKVRTTRQDVARPSPQDLVNRQFTAQRPYLLWVADFTYVSTWQGQMFVAFVIDVYARRMVGWRVSSHMRTDFVVDALEQALYARRPSSDTELIHHSDRGSQYVSIRYTERLEEAGLMPSVGSTGDSYDNALAETINGLYKTEVIYKRGPWKTREPLELATLQWVHWFNHGRLLESIGHIPPAEAEANYWRQVANTVQANACTSTN